MICAVLVLIDMHEFRISIIQWQKNAIPWNKFAAVVCVFFPFCCCCCHSLGSVHGLTARHTVYMQKSTVYGKKCKAKLSICEDPCIYTLFITFLPEQKSGLSCQSYMSAYISHFICNGFHTRRLLLCLFSLLCILSCLIQQMKWAENAGRKILPQLSDCGIKWLWPTRCIERKLKRSKRCYDSWNKIKCKSKTSSESIVAAVPNRNQTN